MPLLIALAAIFSAADHPRPGPPDLGVVCSPTNDLWRVLEACSAGATRWSDIDAAIAGSAPGSGLLLLADGYPAHTLDVTPRQLAAARDQRLRVFIEYAAALPGLSSAPPRGTHWERAVVSSEFLGAARLNQILAIHGCHYVPTQVWNAHISIGRVAGYDKAVFGLPEGADPILFELPEANALVCTTSFSRFVTARYGPAAVWAEIWKRILEWAAPGREIPELSWMPTVRPSYRSDTPLPPSVESDAVARAARWYLRSGLLVHENRLAALAPAFSAEIETGPAQPTYMPRGTGRHGMLEGYDSRIAPDGSQRQRYVIRNDCLGESAMALALAGGEGRAVARELADYMCFHSLIQQGPRADPNHPAFGLMAWGVTSFAWERAFYGDDNARALLGLMATSALLEDDRWEESILRALYANLRTTGKLGFRGDRIDIPELEALGWRHFADRENINRSSHFESYLWACYLWAYRATGDREFLEKAKNAIRTTLEVGSDQWDWTIGIVLERSRMLLCLAWLVRLEDTPEHRAWLMQVAEELRQSQQACGTIQEQLGDPARGGFTAVPSNEAYGTTETPLIQENGDPASDMLYTVNFAFLGLHEAVAATNDPRLRETEDRLAEFLCRIQIRSEAHPELDGAWFRAFDHDKWEYWGSSADIGWGAWCVESGWSVAWITSVLALRQRGTSLWDLTEPVDLRDHLPRVRELMAANAGGPFVPIPAPVPSIAVGAAVDLHTPSSPHYPGTNGDLTDGLGMPVRAALQAKGWLAEPMSATMDLGRIVPISAAGARCHAVPDMGIFQPTGVRVSLSVDGVTFRDAGSRDFPEPEPGDRAERVQEFLVPLAEEARYVRIEVIGLPMLPQWHRVHDAPAWLFVDELVVR